MEQKTLDPWVAAGDQGSWRGAALKVPSLKSERSQRKTETAMFLTNTGNKNKTTQHVYSAWNGLSSSSGIFCEFCLEVSLFPGWIFGSSGIFVSFLGCYLKEFLGALEFFLSILVCFRRILREFWDFFPFLFWWDGIFRIFRFHFLFARRKSDRWPVRFLLSSSYLLPLVVVLLLLICLPLLSSSSPSSASVLLSFPSPPSPSFYFFFLGCFFCPLFPPIAILFPPPPPPPPHRRLGVLLVFMLLSCWRGRYHKGFGNATLA